MQANNPLAVLVVLVLVAAALVITQALVIVQPGTVGVVTRFGQVQDHILPPGLAFKTPVMTKVIPIDTRVKKIETDAKASSKDLQTVTSKVALNYSVDPAEANTIFSDLGPEFERTIIGPAIQESIKATTSKYTAEQLITLREEVKETVHEDLRERLAKFNLFAPEFSIIDFQFSDEFNRAIEEKQVAEQAALRAKNELERIRVEAQQVQAEAEGKAQAELARAKAEAEAQEMLRQTLTPEVLQLRALERWDGTLPVYLGGGQSAPFLTIPQAPIAR